MASLLPPVYRLPAELLCKIFECARQEATDVLSISHVCRPWRDISMSYPRLWSYISISPTTPSLCNLRFHRSGTASLDVMVVIPPRLLDDDAVVEITTSLLLLSFNSERLRTLQLKIPAGTERRVGVLDLPAPRLEKFVCSSTDLQERQHRRIELPTLFQGFTPNLRSLQLTRVRDSVLESLSNLISLSLGFGEEAGDAGQRLYGLLRRCPLLQFLELHSYLLYDTSDFGPSIPLPCMTELKLYNTNSRYILSNIDTPILSTLHIEKPRSTADTNDIMYSFGLPDDVARVVILQRLKTISINPIGNGFSIQGGDNSGVIEFLFEHTWNFPTIFDHLSRAQFPNLTELKFGRGGIPQEGDSVCRFLRNAPSLKVLQMETIASPPFLRLLLDTAICPQLDTIVVAITPATLGEVFAVIKDIVSSRAAVFSQIVRVGHIVKNDGRAVSKGSEHVILSEWSRLCDDNQIQRL